MNDRPSRPPAPSPRTACSAGACGSGSRRRASRRRSIRCFSPRRCRPAPGELVLDVGGGSRRRGAVPRRAGAAAAASSASKCSATGRLAARERRAQRHGRRGSTIIVGDLLRPPPRLRPGIRSTMSWPTRPSSRRARHAVARPRPRRRRTFEGEADLADWVRFCLTHGAAARAALTFVHRADRLDALLAALAGRAGEIVVFPLWPAAAAGEPHPGAGRKGSRARRPRLPPGLVLHEADGRFSAGGRGGAARRRGA